jgi:hypothetical protein
VLSLWRRPTHACVRARCLHHFPCSTELGALFDQTQAALKQLCAAFAERATEARAADGMLEQIAAFVGRYLAAAKQPPPSATLESINTVRACLCVCVRVCVPMTHMDQSWMRGHCTWIADACIVPLRPDMHANANANAKTMQEIARVRAAREHSEAAAQRASAEAAEIARAMSQTKAQIARLSQNG